MNTFADDLAELINVLNLRNAVLVGQSAGGRCGVVCRPLWEEADRRGRADQRGPTADAENGIESRWFAPYGF